MPELSLIAALVGGLVIMALAGNALVGGAVSLAARMGVSPLVAGIFIVGFGTSAPEMIVSLDAALSDRSGLALGNIVGSNIANVFLVLGLPALIAPIAAGGVGEKRGLTAVVIAAVAWIGLTAIMPLTPLIGICFIALLIAYSGLTFIAARRAVAAGKDPGVTEEEDPHLPLWLALIYVPLGVLGLILGADLVIEGGVGIAMFLNVPEEYIGLTLLAFGTSLPEIGAGLAAVMKKQGEVLIGNVLGSNVFNILGAGGIISLFGPVQMAPTFQQYDHWALALATLVIGYVILAKARIGRLMGLLLLLIYVAYIYGLITGLNITGLFQPAGT